MRDLLVIDGAYGEGGGQILRTALALAALTGQAVQFVRIRAGRRRPGLAAQHLTAVRAAAALCSASLNGDRLGSQDLIFRPQRPVRPGHYSFDVAAAREGGSAGAAALVLQTVMVPLALCAGPSEVVVHGGTHLPQSPPFD
jgi:RNA 3'-terminal phosphate cyclase (ATP)